MMQLVDVVFVLLVIVPIFHPGGMWCYAEVENLAGPTAWLSRNLSTGNLSGGGDGPRWPTHGGNPQSSVQFPPNSHFNRSELHWVYLNQNWDKSQKKNAGLMMNIATQGLPGLLGARDGDSHWGS